MCEKLLYTFRREMQIEIVIQCQYLLTEMSEIDKQTENSCHSTRLVGGSVICTNLENCGNVAIPYD